jgi:quinol monooxygenase YgiN
MPELMALLIAAPRFWYCQLLRIAVWMEWPIDAVGCLVVEMPPEQVGAFLKEQERLRQAIQEQTPGLVGYYVYQDTDNAGRLITVHTWRSVGDLAQFRDAACGDWVAHVRSQGATATQCSGVRRAAYPEHS